MSKEELENKLKEVTEKLTALGDLNALLDQGKNLPSAINELQAKKTEIQTYLDKLPEQINKVSQLTSEVNDLIINLGTANKEFSENYKKLNESNAKVEELVQKTTDQLGIAANIKLSHTFENVKHELIGDKLMWFKWLVASVLLLIITTNLLVLWQVKDGKTIFDYTFLIKLALTSPFVYFTVFINREYNRTRSLIEEYTFKAAISKSFDAYHEIIRNSDSPDLTRKLDFLTKSIEAIYSSPMVNIKKNFLKEKENSPNILDQVKSLTSDETKL